MGACERSFEEACADLSIGLVAGGGSMVGVVVTSKIGCRRVDEMTRGAATVIVLVKMESYFLAK